MDPLAEIVIPPLPGTYTYRLEAESSADIEVGYSVEVPFGRRRAIGYVVARTTLTPERRKLLDGIDLKTVTFSEKCFAAFLPSQLPFFSWIADYYCQPLSIVIDTAVPSAASVQYERFVTLLEKDHQKNFGPVQAKLIKRLKLHKGSISYQELSKTSHGAAQALRRLHDSGLIDIHALPKKETPKNTPIPDWAKRKVALNTAQQEAYQRIKDAVMENRFETLLLHGVTGSGKTEVYIEAVQLAQRQGRGALIIVPEIALTPQLIDRFAARLGVPLAVLHSALSKRDRWLAWQTLLDGRCQIAIGARSGIFAPISNVGVIIVDEEHDSSYKQSDSLRYHARDLAVVRGKLSNCPVVLGSATPSLESFYNALRKKYHYLTLPLRHSSASQVKIKIVDLNQQKPWEMKSRNLSHELHEALEETLKSNEQAFILYNRRGFASYLQCDTCQKVLECPNCTVTLTFHKKENLLRCHYCDYQTVPFKHCPHCDDASHALPAPKENEGAALPGKLIHRGAGTEKVYEELYKLFPTARIDRLDSDVAANTAKLNAILEKVRNKETDILVGTQMIAKGHDLPGVTLVGVVDCDVGLHLPDFRAAERVFQLLTQASGRAGRSSAPGQVILQTRVPLHPSLLKTVEKDFPGFAKQELANRNLLHYPPFTRILRIIAGATDATTGLEVLRDLRARIADLIATHKLPIAILGPAQAPIQKL
ncbi:MAG: primosomal protein N', partial [Deltaproteobacteria bacterium]|nr:primosomal protein N' [Deltaproteobacteria bacterium]